MLKGRRYCYNLARLLCVAIAGIVLLGTETGCVPTTTTQATIPKGTWKFIPLKADTKVIGDGWQWLTIEMAVENSTPQWGSVDLDRQGVTIVVNG